MKAYDDLQEKFINLEGKIINETLVDWGNGMETHHLNNGVYSTKEYYQEIYDVKFEKQTGEIIEMIHRTRTDIKTQVKYKDIYYIPIPDNYFE